MRDFTENTEIPSNTALNLLFLRSCMFTLPSVIEKFALSLKFFSILLVNLFLFSFSLTANPGLSIREANNKATYQPHENQFQNAAMIFDWQPHKIYQIYTEPNRITDIALEPGEILSSIAGGDTQRWSISESESGHEAAVIKHVFIKPHQTGLSNNLVLTTDRRVYHIELHAQKNIPYQAAVMWNYPKPLVIFSKPKAAKEKEPLDGMTAKQLNFAYHFVAKENFSWMPQKVFDDGEKTYIQFADKLENEEAPVLWALSKSKQRQVINYRRHENFYIIDHLINLAELAIGKDVLGIERENF